MICFVTCRSALEALLRVSAGGGEALRRVPIRVHPLRSVEALRRVRSRH